MTDSQQIYLKTIHSCFQGYEESRSYFDRLIDHIGAASVQNDKVNLQKIRYLQSRPKDSFVSYPTCAPFDAMEEPLIRDSTQVLPRVAILEGYPSAASTVLLGSLFNIRPEFFIDHLVDNLPSGTTRGLYEQPTLPSRLDNIVRIPFARLIERRSLYTSSDKNIIRDRRDIVGVLDQHDKSIASEKWYGATRYRRINLHDQRFCSTEQNISLTISKQGESWNGMSIVLSDHGTTVMLPSHIPWTSNEKNGCTEGLLPLVPYNLLAGNEKDDQIHGLSLAEGFDPFRRIVINDVADLELLIQDPFFILVGCLTTAFLTWSQLVNLVSEIIATCHHQLDLGEDRLRYQLEQLKYHVGVLQHVKETLLQSLPLIHDGGCPSWPKASTEGAIDRKTAMQKRLLADHEHLVSRCSMLTSEAESATTVLVGFASLVAAEKSISQSREVNQLTRLAIIFAPLSFTTSIFGMNVRQWDPAPSWWWPVISSVVAVVVSLLILRWRSLWGSARRIWKRWPRQLFCV